VVSVLEIADCKINQVEHCILLRFVVLTNMFASIIKWNSCADLMCKAFFSQPASSTNALPVQLDSQGRVKYDALVKQGQRKDKVICSVMLFLRF